MVFDMIKILTLLLFVSCTASKNRTNIEWTQNMMKQPAVKAQRSSGGIGPMKPPEGTKALGKVSYPYAGDVDKAIRNLINPYKKTRGSELLVLGKRNYQKACVYCHGGLGAGDGSMRSLMIVLPPSLLTKKVRRMSDAQIYHIIHEGQGLMGSYRLQIRTPKERWALIYYIRNLQNMSKSY